ncbi:MAG: class II aldolase/adducin family protein [Christensenellaceae bacterium]|jgi:L-ribulose-5-phosphate 4-epimerase|nr:class II aldolase/adducin family protein [Christensenellaceae bacterium]
MSAELRKLIKDAGVRLVKENLVQGTWGNISVRSGNGKMLVTPSGMDYIRMSESDVVEVDIETLEWDKSGVKPTSEKKIHASVYRQYPNINVVLHAHPYFSSAFAAAGAVVPSAADRSENLIALGAALKAKAGGEIIVGSYGLPGTKKLTKGVVNALPGRKACLMANHGLLVLGETLEEAFELLKAIENYCEAVIRGKLLILPEQSKV